MINIWFLLALQTSGVYSNRTVFHWEQLATFGTREQCISASKALADRSFNLPNEIGVSSIIKFECIEGMK